MERFERLLRVWEVADSNAGRVYQKGFKNCTCCFLAWCSAFIKDRARTTNHSTGFWWVPWPPPGWSSLERKKYLHSGQIKITYTGFEPGMNISFEAKYSNGHNKQVFVQNKIPKRAHSEQRLPQGFVRQIFCHGNDYKRAKKKKNNNSICTGSYSTSYLRKLMWLPSWLEKKNEWTYRVMQQGMRKLSTKRCAIRAATGQIAIYLSLSF